MMDQVDTMLARLATVSAPFTLGGDPGFVGRLDASAARGELMGMVRSLALGVMVAGLMVAVHPAPAASDGLLLATAAGEVL